MAKVVDFCVCFIPIYIKNKCVPLMVSPPPNIVPDKFLRIGDEAACIHAELKVGLCNPGAPLMRNQRPREH